MFAPALIPSVSCKCGRIGKKVDSTLKILRYFEYFLCFFYPAFHLKRSITACQENLIFKNAFLWNRSLVVDQVVRDRKILNSIFGVLSEKRYGAAKHCRCDIWFPDASRQNVLFTGTQTKNPIAADWQRASKRLRIDPRWRHLTDMQQSHLLRLTLSTPRHWLDVYRNKPSSSIDHATAGNVQMWRKAALESVQVAFRVRLWIIY